MSDFSLTGARKINLYFDIKGILNQGIGNSQLETLELKNVSGFSMNTYIDNNDLSLLSLNNLRSLNFCSTVITPINLIDLIRKLDLTKLEYLNLVGNESKLSLEKPEIMSDSEKKLFDIISQKYEYEIMRDGPLNVKHQDLDFVRTKKKNKKKVAE